MRIIFYTGKGGVGKTSIAAATACGLADSGKKVLIMSTDRAHSLGDSFEMTLKKEETRVMENLYALEIDVEQESERAWGQMRGYLKELLSSRAQNGLETEELLAFPGLEELFAMLKILDFEENGKYDVLIVDCAPTGETLSLLKSPELFGQFIKRVLPMERKVVKIAGPLIQKATSIPMPEDSLFDELAALTDRIAQMQALMSDTKHVSLRVVTTPERIVIKEAKRCFTWLHMYGYQVDAIFVNRIYPKRALEGYFSRFQELQEEGMKEIFESFSPIPIFPMELREQELKSIPILRQAFRELYKDIDASNILYASKLYELKKREDGYVLQMSLPLADKQEIDLTRKGDELILNLQNMKRHILLPDILKNKEIQRAKYEAQILSIYLY